MSIQEITPNGTCRFVFKLRFKDRGDLEEYIKTWREGSQIIQDESEGAEGTRLHEVLDEPFTLLAIAQWASKEARDIAFQALEIKYSPDSSVYTNGRGEIEIIGHAVQIETVIPNIK